MAGTLLILNLFYLLSILISSGAHGVSIQAYRHKNFTRLVWESRPSAACNNIPRNKITYVNSIRTDTCFNAYSDPDCKSYWSQTYVPGDIVLAGRDLTWIQSFQVCNEEEGGSQLNLDITSYYALVASVPPDVLQSYKNVCSCVNVSQYVQNISKWSINNHHNALLAYYEPGCLENKWNSIFVPAGHNLYSRDVHEYQKYDSVTKTTYKISSFGPDPNSTYFQTSCIASHVTTTESSKTFTTQNQLSLNSDFNKRFQVLANQILELQRNQSDMRKEQTTSITKLNQTVTALKQGFLDFTTKIKSDLRDLFA